MRAWWRDLRALARALRCPHEFVETGRSRAVRPAVAYSRCVLCGRVRVATLPPG